MQRALDTDPKRRYKTATDLLENLIEAMEDDRWELADTRRADPRSRARDRRREHRRRDRGSARVARQRRGASHADAPEHGPARRAGRSRARARPACAANKTGGRLDALLADLDGSDHTNVTHVDDGPYRRDPISELIQLDPRKREAIVSSDARAVARRSGRLDAAAAAESRLRLRHAGEARRAQSSSSGARELRDEAAALAAIGDLDEGARRINSVGDQAAVAAMRLEEAAGRAERAAQKLETDLPKPKIERHARAPPIADPLPELDAPSMRVKSRMGGVLGILVILHRRSARST